VKGHQHRTVVAALGLLTRGSQNLRRSAQATQEPAPHRDAGAATTSNGYRRRSPVTGHQSQKNRRNYSGKESPPD